jgi:hypothetical protein
VSNKTPFGKKVVNKCGSVCYYYRSFFPWNFTHVSKNRLGTLVKRKKCLIFKHEKNNQTLSNDWPTYCPSSSRYGVNSSTSVEIPVSDEDISKIKVVQYHLIYLNIMSKGGGWGLSLLLQMRV